VDSAAPALIISFLAGSDSLEVLDEIGAVGDQARGDAALGDGREQLLGAAAADAGSDSRVVLSTQASTLCSSWGSAEGRWLSQRGCQVCVISGFAVKSYS